MPENPLLPNAKLQKLYGTMLRARAGAIRPRGFEAIFGALAEQLDPGDAVVSSGQPHPLTELVQPTKRMPQAANTVVATTSPLAFAAGMAASAQAAGVDRLVAALLDIRRPEPGWPGVLEHIQRDRLPLIAICPEMPGGRTSRADDVLTWQALSRVVKKIGLPVLTVDGGDAVAMYRALQESVLRARHRDGAALLWCVMPPAGRGKGFSPVQRLESYMDARSIARPRA